MELSRANDQRVFNCLPSFEVGSPGERIAKQRQRKCCVLPVNDFTWVHENLKEGRGLVWSCMKAARRASGSAQWQRLCLECGCVNWWMQRHNKFGWRSRTV